jgi:mycothiol synthase
MLMSGDGVFSWRPIEPGDAGNWSALLAAIQVADQDWEFFTEQDLLEEFDDPHHDFARGSTCIHDDGTMVGYGVLLTRDSADPVHEMRFKGGIHPACRRRGLGGQLLDWAEATASTLHRELHPDRPLSLSGSCVAGNAGAVALYAAHGYRPVRSFYAMIRDLTADLPGIPAPAGVEIVGFTPERSENARLVRNEAFRDHWGSTETSAESWAQFMGSNAFRPAFSFLAYKEGEPVGFVIGHEYDAFAAATGTKDLYIALLGTRRSGRKRGIGSALLFRALSEARAAGFTSASLGVDADSLTGALGLYERAGFTIEHTSITQTKKLLP